MEPIVNEGEFEGAFAVEPVTEPLGDFDFWNIFTDGFQSLRGNGLGVAQ